MALTKMQKKATIEMFILAFIGSQSKDDRKKLFIEFEDIFGAGIKDWQNICREEIAKNTSNQEILEEFDSLVLRKENVTSLDEYQVRPIKEDDFVEIKQLVRTEFDLSLSDQDDTNIREFMDQGYSYVLCRGDIVVGLILAFLKPTLSGNEVFIDTLVVEENLRGQGLGKRLLKQVLKKAYDNDIFMAKLQTDKGIDAYRIYEHLGFRESQMVQMSKILFYERWLKEE